MTRRCGDQRRNRPACARANGSHSPLNFDLCVHRVSVVKSFQVEDHLDAMNTEKRNPMRVARRGPGVLTF